MKQAERRWQRMITEMGERLADETGLGVESGFRLLKMALAWRLMSEAGLPVQAETWPERWRRAEAWMTEFFTYPVEWEANVASHAALFDPIVSCQAPVSIEQSLAFVHQLSLDRQGQGHLKVRRTKGSYYTPKIIVDQLLADTLDLWIEGWQERWFAAAPYEKAALRSELVDFRVLDPACGAGAFLLEAWERLIPCWQLAGDPCPVRSALLNLMGWEQDAGAVQMLKVIIAARLHALGVSCGEVILSITIGDFLQHHPSLDQQVAIVIGNPPWVRAKYSLNGQEDERRAHLGALRKQFPELAVGELNLYTLFISRSLDWLAPGGRLAFITPNSFLLDRNSEGLRRRLLASCRIQRLTPLSEREGRALFEGVSQASVLLTFEKVYAGTNEVVASCPEAQSHWSELPYALMVSGTVQEMRLLHRLLGFPSLAERFTIQDGELHLTRCRDWIKEQHEDGLIPMLRGDDLSRHNIEGHSYVCLNRALSERWQGLIDGRRILLQRIANQHKKRRLRGAIVHGVIAANSTVALIPKDEDADHLLPETLKLLHSNLYHWLLMKLSSDNNIPAWKLKLLPWLPPTPLRDEMDAKNINHLVYVLYDLNWEEQEMVERMVGTTENHAV